MRYSLFALGAGNMAMAIMSNSTDGQANDKAVANTMPPVVGDYELIGCSAANDDFKNFVKVATTEDMDLDFCSASCQSKFMAVSGKDCFCGDKADPAIKVDVKMCNTPCPGNWAQSCGGDAGDAHRDAAAPMKHVSMYMRARAARADGATTHTITSTRVAIITKCPPTVTNCPLGKPTHHVVTKVTEICPRPTEVIEWHKKKITCYGGHCSPEVSYEGYKQRVICDGEKCHSETSVTKEWSSLVICKGDECKWPTCGDYHWFEKKIVCYDGKCAWEKCHGDECHKKFVCKGDECKHEQCSGDDCHKKFICDDKGDNCKPAPPPCNGKDCPKPPPPCHGENCPAPLCHGENCPAPSCHGENCQHCPPPPCHGENCKMIPCNGTDCVKPIRPTGSAYPQPIHTNPPIAAGASNMVVNLLCVVAGLVFVV
ncbi:hypothetical protein ED733_007400 [Metarhizium rileyi]|uniref:WSC domain-containing protein n=1 Tax=Metarhizium rileyi (strain RCEF 4871) TaxID=1649241 RepID=A0A5C6GIN8_METRR|nr:hypothetical protein ED733_007400 [Metarhizium rileyi]